MTRNEKDCLLQSEHWPVILCFFERFGETLGFTSKFQGIENVVLATTCGEDVVCFFHKLLHSFGQRLRKRYSKYLWEKALVAFAETYQMECVETLRKGGYLSLSVADRLPLIKELCEAQFDVCAHLKDKVNSDFSAEELRLKPLVQDKYGDGYWLFMDSEGQFVLYKELTSSGPSSEQAKMKVVACTLDELDEFLCSLRANGVQRAGRTIGISEGQNSEEGMLGDDIDAYCEICNVDRDPNKLLLCDSCNHGYHTDCLSPPLSVVPAGDWHCSPCLEDKLFTVIEEKQKGIANLVRKADRCRRQEARCLKLEEEAAFFAGISTGRRTRSMNPSDKEFYSYKAFDRAIQLAIYQNEKKAFCHMNGKVNGTETAHHFGGTLAALCDPMRRHTRAVSRLATQQVELVCNRHGKQSSPKSAAETVEILSSNESSSPAYEQIESVSSYSSSEAESEDMPSVSDSSSCRSNSRQTMLDDWRKPCDYDLATRTNGIRRPLRASKRAASRQLAKLVCSGALKPFNENQDDEDFKGETTEGEASDASDSEQVVDPVTADANTTMMSVRRLRRVRLIVSEDSSDDNCIGRGSVTAVKRQFDSDSGDTSNLEVEDHSDDVIWRRKRKSSHRLESLNVVTERNSCIQHCFPSEVMSSHSVQNDHCYSKVMNRYKFVCNMCPSTCSSDAEQTLDSQVELKHIVIRPRQMRKHTKRHYEYEGNSAKRKARTISTTDAVSAVTSEEFCDTHTGGRMVEDEIDSFSSGIETIPVICCNKEDMAIDEFSSD